MKQLLLATRNFLSEEEGASAVEYGLLVALISAVIVATVATLGTRIHTAFISVCSALGAVCT